MDYFAHGFWSYIFYHRSSQPLYAVLFGLLPDTLSWGIYLIYQLISGGIAFGRPDLAAIPEWVFLLYGLTHSLLVFGAVLLIIYLFARKIPIYIYAWPIAIIMDTLTHSRNFLPTPFLWPIEWYFPGFSWGNQGLMAANYILIIAGLSYSLWWRNRRRKQLKTDLS